MSAEPDSQSAHHGARAPLTGRRRLWARRSWMLFDWAAQPFPTLVTSFAFGPYVATVLAPDPVTGQVWWSCAIGAIGLLAAICAPVLGARVDRSANRMRTMAVLAVVYVVSITLTVIAAPGQAHLLVPVLALVVVAGVANELMTVTTNGMIPDLSSPEDVGKLSGTGWAFGYAAAVLSLLLVVCVLAPQEGSETTLFGLPPLIGGAPEAHWPERMMGPLAAIWFAVFVIPLFLLAPRAGGLYRTSDSDKTAPLTLLKRRLLSLRQDPPMIRFLLANMFAKDGIIAIASLGGVLAAGLFGWGGAELGLFGLLITIVAFTSTLVGGILDDCLGSRSVILGGLLLYIIAGLGLVTTSENRLLLFIEVSSPTDGDVFLASTPEQAFLVFGLLVGLASGPVQASFRTQMARLAPNEEITEHFGLLALSGRMTAFAGPLVAGVVTTTTGNQSVGVGSVLVFSALGFWLMWGVPATRRTSS